MNKPENPILVTRPSLPDLKEFTKKLENIWESKWLTNNGIFKTNFCEIFCSHRLNANILACNN